MNYSTLPEIVLGETPEINVPELAVSYTRSGKRQFGKITSSKDAADFIRKTFGEGQVELQEQFIVLYLNQANEIIGYYKHSKGAINATVADIRIVLATALKALAVSMVIAHNHPSGDPQPSAEDRLVTQRLREAGELVGVPLLDHLVVGADRFYSFAEEAFFAVG